MATIKKEKYADHELIPVIETCLEQAIAGNSGLPQRCLDINGMSGHVYRRFVNNYIRTALENPRYLEVGTWQGSTLCAAIGGIENIEAIAVDNFTLGGASLSQCKINVDIAKTESAKVEILDMDFRDFDFTNKGKFDVYFYDGNHAEQFQCDAITRCPPIIDDVALIIIDDWNDWPTHFTGEFDGQTYYSHIKVGTYRGFKESGLKILYKIEVETGENPFGVSDWHNGYGIFLVSK